MLASIRAIPTKYCMWWENEENKVNLRKDRQELNPRLSPQKPTNSRTFETAPQVRLNKIARKLKWKFGKANTNSRQVIAASMRYLPLPLPPQLVGEPFLLPKNISFIQIESPTYIYLLATFTLKCRCGSLS